MIEKYVKQKGVPEGMDVKKLITTGKKCLEKQ